MPDDYLIRQAKLYLEGFSLRQIAAQEGTSHITIRNNLVKKLKRVPDQNYYIQVIAKLHDNAPDSIEKPEVMDRVLKVYHLSVDEDKTIEEITRDLGATVFTIYRDLTVRLKKINEKYPKMVTEEMLEKSKTALNNRSLECLVLGYSPQPQPVKTPKFRLDRIYSEEKAQYKFLVHAMLTFRVTTKTMSAWIQMDENVLYQKIMEYNGHLDKAFQYLNDFDNVNQEKAIKSFDDFYSAFLKAKLTGQKKVIEPLLHVIGDQDFIAVKKEIQTTRSIRMNQVEPIVRYIIKYSAYPLNMPDILGISSDAWSRIVNKYLQDKPELRAQYENLIHTIPEINFNAGGRGNG